MDKFLILPPVAFVLILAVSLAILYLFSRLSFRSGAKPPAGAMKPYACGEDDYCPTVQPDYSSFFRFAFFFTLAHVAVLVIATLPKVNIGLFFMALIYVEAAITGLFILFKN